MNRLLLPSFSAFEFSSSHRVTYLVTCVNFFRAGFFLLQALVQVPSRFLKQKLSQKQSPGRKPRAKSNRLNTYVQSMLINKEGISGLEGQRRVNLLEYFFK